MPANTRSCPRLGNNQRQTKTNTITPYQSQSTSKPLDNPQVAYFRSSIIEKVWRASHESTLENSSSNFIATTLYLEEGLHFSNQQLPLNTPNKRFALLKIIIRSSNNGQLDQVFMVKFEGYTLIERESAVQSAKTSIQILILWLLLLSSSSDTGKSANTNPNNKLNSSDIIVQKLNDW